MTFDYIKPTEEQIAEMQTFREAYTELYEKVKALPASRGISIALTKLEESNMWVNKALTHNDQQ